MALQENFAFIFDQAMFMLLLNGSLRLYFSVNKGNLSLKRLMTTNNNVSGSSTISLTH